MLKDVTLGQFFPGSSIVHRLDPRCKLLLTIVYIAALFTAQSYVSYAVMLVITGVCIALSRIQLKVILRGLKPLWVDLLDATPGERANEVFPVIAEGRHRAS